MLAIEQGSSLVETATKGKGIVQARRREGKEHSAAAPSTAAAITPASRSTAAPSAVSC